MNLYSVIGLDGRIKLAQIVPHANIQLLRGERMVRDQTPQFDGRYQRCTRVEPVDSAAEFVSYVVEYLPLDQIKATVRQQLNVERDRRESSTFPYLGHDFDCDSRSVQRINTVVQAAQAALAAGQPFGMDWTAADDTEVQLTAEQLVGLPVALAIHANTIHQTCKQLKQQVEAATTPEEVLAVTWPA